MRTATELRASLIEELSWSRIRSDDPGLDGSDLLEKPRLFPTYRKALSEAFESISRGERCESLPISGFEMVAERDEWEAMARLVLSVEVEDLIAYRRWAAGREGVRATTSDRRQNALTELGQLRELASDEIEKQLAAPWGDSAPDEEDDRLRGIPVSRDGSANYAKIGTIASASSAVELLEDESGLSIEELRAGIPGRDGGHPTALERVTRSALVATIARVDARRKVSREALAEALDCHVRTVSRLRKAAHPAAAA